MKLLAFTDLHCNKAALNEIKNKAINEKPDLIVCCGDLSNFTSGLNEIAKFLNSLNIKILIIPGNHETNIDINEICGKYNNLINIHLASYEIDNYLFFGFGTGGFSSREEKLERAMKEFKKTFDKNKKLIFVTHAPIYNTKLDELWDEHRGCISSRKFIEEFEPILTLCGHFHENEKKKDKIKNCTIVNPGKNGMIIKV
ncbi:metallophosphoesterase family protein [Candidatus Woesearchaeota archaeon]|nr:metallophosphoesterase family protein [Candidatus Woesearchaeota archaeon]